MSETTTLDEQARVVKFALINSYRFSRGNINVQDQIVAYAGVQLRGQLDSEAFEAAIEPTVEACQRIAYGSKRHVTIKKDPQSTDAKREMDARIEIQDHARKLRAFNIYPHLGVDYPYLAAALLKADYRWLPERRQNSAFTLNRPFASNFVKHGLALESTGSELFDGMFQEAAAVGYVALLANTKPTEFWEKDAHEQYPHVLSAHLASFPEHADAINRVLGTHPISAS